MPPDGAHRWLWAIDDDHELAAALRPLGYLIDDPEDPRHLPLLNLARQVSHMEHERVRGINTMPQVGGAGINPHACVVSVDDARLSHANRGRDAWTRLAVEVGLAALRQMAATADCASDDTA